MLSILIPTYNEDCTALVSELLTQARACLDGHYEIIVGDDGSTRPDVRAAIRRLGGLEGVRCIEMTCNVGRAKIRNHLADQSHGDYLLFIDSDARVCRSDFVARYARAAQPDVVVCGSLVNTPTPPSARYSLRFRYEAAAVRLRSLPYRRKHPYAQFTAFNFMIPRDMFMAIRFNEHITDYGYEDALLGYELKQRGIKVEQIDNQLVHTGIDTNEAFIDKTHRSLCTLRSLGSAACHYSRLARTARRLRPLRPLIVGTHHLLGSLMLKNLMGPKPSLRVFTLYKLGYYCSLKPQNAPQTKHKPA